jgi:hypothetical protein
MASSLIFSERSADMGFTVRFNDEQHKGEKEGGMLEHLRIYLSL